jgi:hypothetical protein
LVAFNSFINSYLNKVDFGLAVIDFPPLLYGRSRTVVAG